MSNKVSKSKKFSHRALLLTILSLSPPIYAEIYCSAGGSYLKLGMSTAQVEQSCGAPITQDKKKTAATRNVAIQQLFYNIKQFTRNIIGPRSIPSSSIELMVTIRNDKVTYISLSGTNTQGATVCPNGAIQVGSSINTVTYACGTPTYVNQSYQKVSQGTTVEQETWTIKPTQYGPTKTLIFTDGILRAIE